ncbi:MAG: oxidative damage protection protein [Legionella sp.]|nr:oxidative damage protection protein [Legionella sp.]
MSRQILCVKLNAEKEGFEKPPFPGPLGVKIFEHISKEAWQMWLAHQTMLINEYRLSLVDPKAREFLQTEMDKYLFGQGSDKPAGYVPE